MKLISVRFTADVTECDNVAVKGNCLLIYCRYGFVLIISLVQMVEGHVVASLVEAMRYKPEGRGFDSQLCNWNFSLT